MNKKYIAHIISHSHWDREWYFTFEAFRLRLLEMIDNLLDILEEDNDFYAFMLDGHTILLEDYLEIEPYNRCRLKKHIKEGRILIGPWYILPDQVLISGESHIRNYLFGDRICRAFGQKMNIGYAPDAFGHPAQIPQIYSKLGLQEILFWRGLSDEVTKNEFVWEAPDGSQILGINLPFGYGNCPNLPDDKEAFLKRIKNVIARCEPTSTTRIMPIMNGRDHLEAQKHIPAMIGQVNNLDSDIQLKHSTLPEFVHELRANLQDKELECYKGSLYSSDKTFLLAGTLSTRMYLKQLNHQIQDLYEKWLEPFSSVNSIENSTAYPQHIINHGWKYILQNQPHDSITGCSVDEVHREMEVRYDKTRQIGETMLDKALQSVISVEEEVADDIKECWLAVFNPSTYHRTEVVKGYVDLFPRLHCYLSYEELKRVYFDDSLADHPLPTSLKLKDAEGNIYPAQVLKGSIEKDLRYYTYKQPHEFYFHRCYIAFEAKDIPPLGYKVYKVLPYYDEEENKEISQGNSIENDYFEVEIVNGKINIWDKRNDKWYYNCSQLVDEGDRGDEYTFVPVPKDLEIHAAGKGGEVKILEDNDFCKTIALSYNFKLPSGLTKDEKSRSQETVDCPVTIEATIYSNLPRADFRTTVENKACNHRLRVFFPTDLKAEYYFTEGTFSVDRHPVKKTFKENRERVVTSYQKSFVSVDKNNSGVTIANKGLPEVEVRETEKGATIFLTLLRCVGWLANTFSGLSFPTPEAQCLGKHVFEYSFIPHQGNWLESKAYKAAHDFNNRLAMIQLRDGTRPRFGSRSYLSIEPEELVLSAFKLAEERDNIFILRFYNSSPRQVGGKIVFGFTVKKAYLCDLREKLLEELKVCNKSIKVSVKPWEIVTLAIEV
jgi:alpha-mannosidase